MVVIRIVWTHSTESQSILCFVGRWCSAMLLFMMLFLVARLGSVDTGGLAVAAFDLLNCSLSVFRFVFVL